MPDSSGTPTPRDRAVAAIAEKIWEIHGPLSTDEDSAESDAIDIVDHLLASPDILRELAGQEPLHEVVCPSCSATIRARMADSPASTSPSGGEPAVVVEPGTPDDPCRALCPHCEDGHQDPRTVSWGVWVAPERDGDGQPTHLRVERTQGSHVALSDADWLWNLIRTYRDAAFTATAPARGTTTPAEPSRDDIAEALHHICTTPVDYQIGMACTSAANHSQQADAVRALLDTYDAPEPS